MPTPPPPKGKPFEKGKSGNPNGRPPGKNITTVLRDLMDIERKGSEIDPDIAVRLGLNPNKKYSQKLLIAMRLANHAVSAEHPEKAATAIMDRLDGKPHQTVQLDTTSTVNMVINSPYDPTKDPDNKPTKAHRGAGKKKAK